MTTPGSFAWRKIYWPACSKANLKVGYFGPQKIKLAVADGTHEAWGVLFDTMARHDYVVRPLSTGAYNCRQQTGSTVLSAHASGIALDVNWDTNPYVKGRLVTDMPREMVVDIESIRTKNGKQVFRWGGDWDGRPDTKHDFYDGMHWEIICTPEDLATGILIQIYEVGPSKQPILRVSRIGPAVGRLQQLLTKDGFTVVITNNFDVATNTAVRAYQKSRGLKVDGVVGPATWTALLNDLPPVGKSDVRPNKTSITES